MVIDPRKMIKIQRMSNRRSGYASIRHFKAFFAPESFSRENEIVQSFTELADCTALTQRAAHSTAHDVHAHDADAANDAEFGCERIEADPRNSNWENWTIPRINEQQAFQFWQQSAAVIGLHPDSATDSIFARARSWNKSFFVVPCCLFQKQIRRFHRDQPVTTHQQFAEMQQSRGASIAELEFEGQNVVLYQITQ